jgi:hypothetical protein
MIHKHMETLRTPCPGPSLEEVNRFFIGLDYPLEESEVFFFYYQGLGWRTESGSPLRDWKAAAATWLYNLEN